MALIINDLKTSTNFLAGTQLKASDLNEAFWQPLLLTNAIAKAIASCDVNLDSVVEETITAETPNLDQIFATALQGLLKYKPETESYNYSQIRFDSSNDESPYIVLESVLRSKTGDVISEIESNRMQILPNSFLIQHKKTGEQDSNIEISFENNKSIITADKFEGLATKLEVNDLSGNENDDYAILLGNDNVVNSLTGFSFNPFTKSLKVPSSTEIKFSANDKITATYYTGTSERANKINLSAGGSSSDYFPLIYGFAVGQNEGKLYATDASKIAIQPSSGYIKAVRFEGTVDKSDTVMVSPQSSNNIYLCGVLNDGQTYKNCYYNPSAYIDPQGNLYASSFQGSASSATYATTIGVTNTSDDDTFYLPFVDSTSTGVKNIYVNSGIYVNPSEGSISATLFDGTADNAIRLSSTKTITLTGVLTGSTTTNFGSDYIGVSTSLATKYLPTVIGINGSLKNKTVSVSWADGTSANLYTSAWIAYLLIDPNNASPVTCVFKHTANNSYTSEYKTASKYNWRLKVASGNVLTLQWSSSSSFADTSDFVGTIVFVPIKISS